MKNNPDRSMDIPWKEILSGTQHYSTELSAKSIAAVHPSGMEGEKFLRLATICRPNPAARRRIAWLGSFVALAILPVAAWAHTPVERTEIPAENSKATHLPESTAANQTDAAQPGASPAPAEAEWTRFDFMEPHMGMPVRIALYAPNLATANAASRRAFDRIRQIDLACTDYNDESELMRFCSAAPHSQPVAMSDDLYKCLVAAQELAQASDGAFDVTVGPLVQLWKRSRRTGRLPNPAELDAKRQLVGYQRLTLDPEHPAGQLNAAGMRITLGGIAAGFAVDRALEELAAVGIESALIDASGDIAASGPPPGTAGWKVGILPGAEKDAQPRRILSLVHAAVTTSGDQVQFVVIEGVRYSHIVDPRTGLGQTHQVSATVLAPTCTLADGLATALVVLGPQVGTELLSQYPESAAYFSWVREKQQFELETPNFPGGEKILVPATSAPEPPSVAP